MPDSYIFLPFHHHGAYLAAGKEGSRRLNRRGEAGMPGGEQRQSGLPCHGDQRREFADRRAGPFFEQRMLAGRNSRRRLRVAHLRRRAERNGIDIRHILEELVEGGDMLDASDGSVATGNGSEFDARRLSNRGNVLVSGNLSETDDGNADSSHGSLPRPLRIAATGFTSMAWAL